MLVLAIMGSGATIAGLVCCLVAQFSRARSLRFLDTLTGLSAPDTPAFRRYHRCLNRVAGAACR